MELNFTCVSTYRHGKPGPGEVLDSLSEVQLNMPVRLLWQIRRNRRFVAGMLRDTIWDDFSGRLSQWSACSGWAWLWWEVALLT